MLQRELRILEYDKVKEQLVSFAASSLGKERAERLLPSFDVEKVKRMQEETDEAAIVIRLKGQAPLGGIYDIRPQVKRAEIGGALNPRELLDIASTIYGSRNVKRFIEDLIDQEELSLPILSDYAEQLVPLPKIEQSINQSIDDSGYVMDGASDKLRAIRQQLRSTESRIKDKLDQLTKSQSTQKMLSDAIVTIRNDRYVVPVKQEYRGTFGGMVHDQSASGATLFIEPQSVITLNNELQEAKMKEKKEIDRILSELSSLVAEDAAILKQNVEILAEIDFMVAKARYSASIKATKPAINNHGYIRLIKARHPLIPISEAVASDIELGKEYSSIVITGPNTGGKTVTLKTIGLVTLMAQSGLQVPALDGSEIAIFSKIFADIGDEQSIEQSLSTFSSHMTNIVQILKEVDESSLVLFDELGAGTDPQEGAALAISILDAVYNKGARVVATTHYPELKAYGYNRDGVINASVEFDVETLKPTYRLLIGVPGRSNAFEISKRLGLDDTLIEKAKGYVSTESNQVENMIASLEESRKKAEADYEEAHELLAEAENLRADLLKEIELLEREKESVLKQAEEQAKQAVNRAKAEAEAIISNLREMQKRQQLGIKEHELIEARKGLEQAIPTLVKGEKRTIKKVKQHQFKPGDEVKVLSFNQKGHIVEKSGEEFIVQLGIMKMKVAANDMQFIGNPEPIVTRTVTTVKGSSHHVKPELDLRGERYEDAMLKVEKYIDDALLAGYPSVSIIHGKGTGALRKGVQDLAKQHRSVKTARYGGMNEGGTGVTILEFK